MGKPAARMGDMTAHGGAIIKGEPTVLIGGVPAARVSDMHTCPMVTPAPAPVPHVGGPILPPGAPTVLIGSLPAACVGDMATCTGPPDSILPPGCPTVLIGASGAGGAGAGLTGTGQAETSATSDETENHTLDVAFVDSGGFPITGVRCRITDPDGRAEQVALTGRIRKTGVPEGSYEIRLQAITEAKWSATSARDGEAVKMQVQVAGIDDGTPATLQVWERNLNTADALVRSFEDLEVSGGKIEGEWQFEFRDEHEDESGQAETQSQSGSAAQGAEVRQQTGSSLTRRYYRPSYYFTVDVDGCQARSAILDYADHIELSLQDNDGQTVGNARYRVFLSSGEVREGTLDGDGTKTIENVPPGRWTVEFPNHGTPEEH